MNQSTRAATPSEAVLVSATVVADTDSGLRLSRAAAVARWRSPASLGFVAAVPLILMGRQIFNVVSAASRSDAWVTKLIGLYFGLLAVTVVIGLLLTVVQMFLRNRRVMAYASPGAAMSIRYLRDSMEIGLATGTTVIAYDQVRDFFALGGTVFLRARGAHGVALPRQLFPEPALELIGRRPEGGGAGGRRALVLGGAVVVAALVASLGILIPNYHHSNAVGATPTVRKRIPLEVPSFAFAAYADTVYAAAWDDNVRFIDTRTGSVTATIRVGSSAYGMAFDPATHRLYVSSNGESATEGRITVIDTDTKSVSATIPFVQRVWKLAIDAAAQRLYFGEIGDRSTSDPRDSIGVIDTASNSVVGSISVPGDAYDMVIDPATHVVYLGFERRASVYVIDGARMAVTATIPFGDRIRGLALDAAAHTLYAIGDEKSSSVDEFRVLKTIDTASGTIRSTVRLSESAWGVAIDTADHSLYIAEQTQGQGDQNPRKGWVRVLDTRTSAVTASVTFASGDAVGTVEGVILDPVTHRVYAIEADAIHQISR
ncbi:YncE family protein [Nocardia inohanensis]|uniref:YncE family protein n=1 Tax=Nocardia inohanensis TaxID=209246 RepID=UPI00082C0F17|nr:YncE family protein [Nocardia inohanensis]